jgi:sterol desaturase/sphingolipid hydroxylase (fatty acid hydroxylase superfamily)
MGRASRIHKSHHEFRDTSSFVAGHKSFIEMVITTVTDSFPILMLGATPGDLLAWNLVGTAFNLEGHSSLSLLFVKSDFHDLHHTEFVMNYGVQGLWDRLLGTLNPDTRLVGGFVGAVESWMDGTRNGGGRQDC